jgi:nucleoside-diphosphate-sugar epimerase
VLLKNEAADDGNRDVEDCARVHIEALSPRIPSDERYIFRSPEILVGDIVAKGIREEFPQLKDRVPAPLNSDGPVVSPGLVDVSTAKFEREFGQRQWKSMRQSIKETVEDILAHDR